MTDPAPGEPCAILMFHAYVVTCRPTGKQYVGITSEDVIRRWKNHVYYSRRKRSYASALGAAIRKYGALAFGIESVGCACCLEDAHALESLLIHQYGTFAPNGYNLTLGGEGRFGFRPSPQSVEQSAVKHRGRPCHPNTRLAASRFHKGRKRSLEHRARISAAKKGQPRSEGTKAKLRAYWAERRSLGEFKTTTPYEHARKVSA